MPKAKTKAEEPCPGKCYFMPYRKIEKVLELIDSKVDNIECKQNVYEYQLQKSVKALTWSEGRNQLTEYAKVVRMAILDHDWDRLYHLLSNWPLWEYCNKSLSWYTYMKAYIILMQNHPSAKSQSLLLHYFHMVLRCRHDDEKKAYMKVLMSMPKSVLT